MLIVHVHVQVKPECIDAFKSATITNAQVILDMRDNTVGGFGSWSTPNRPSNTLICSRG